MMTAGSVFARVLYGALFVVVIPAGLVLWARALEPTVALTAVHSHWAGALLVAAGLWLVAPTTALGMAALWFGYERNALVARFKAEAIAAPLLGFPPASDEPARGSDRAAVIVWVLNPWLLCWLTVPVLASFRPFRPEHLWGRVLAFEQEHLAGTASFPAFHVIWTMFAAQAWIANARATGRAAWRWVGIGWATLIVCSCLATGMHTILEVITAVVVCIPCSITGEVGKCCAEPRNGWPIRGASGGSVRCGSSIMASTPPSVPLSAPC